MENLLGRLENGDILIGDGATGTMLQSRGLKGGDCPEALNLDRPEVLEEVTSLYVEAGADLVMTNTLGASPLKLAQYSLDDRTEEINVNAVRAVRVAAGVRAYVAASCGPCGGLLKPYGDLTPDDVLAGFERQLRALITEGVDLICIETMSDLAETILAVNAARSISQTVPVAATMTFDPTAKGFYTIMGVSVEQAACGLIDAGADIVGSNCGNGIENMIKIAAEFRRHTNYPLMIQSNAGLPVLEGDVTVYPESPEFMAGKCRELVDIGVNVIGGCCGTTPDHIAAIRRVVNESSGPR